jgi:hypothetical protein
LRPASTLPKAALEEMAERYSRNCRSQVAEFFHVGEAIHATDQRTEGGKENINQSVFAIIRLARVSQINKVINRVGGVLSVFKAWKSFLKVKTF